MKTGTLWIALLSFTLGAAAAAWRAHHSLAWNSGLADGQNPGDQAGGKPGTDADAAAAAWQALMAGGGQGISDRLRQADLVSRASPGDMPRLLELAGKNSFAWELLLRRWAQLDPAGAAAWLRPRMAADFESSFEEQNKDVEIVFSTWAKTDPAAALANLRASSGASEQIIWTNVVLNRLLDEDVAAGVRLGALTGSSSDLNSVYYRPTETDWVKQDPGKAAALLAGVPQGEFRDRNLLVAINALAKTDLAAAIALQEKYPGLKGGFQGRDPERRRDFFQAWAGKDPAGLQAFMSGQAPETDLPLIKEAIARDLGEKDPRAALDWAAANLSGLERTGTTEKILSGLAGKDPEAALAWLVSLSAGTALNSAVDTFAKSLKDGDPAALLAKAESLPEGAARSAITAKAYEKMYQKDPAGMLQNLASQPQSSLPDGLWRQLGASTGDIGAGISRLADLPPDAAADYVRGLFQKNISWDGFSKFTQAMSTLTDPANRATAIDTALPKVLGENPSMVTDWAKTLPAAERNQVADQMEKNIYNITDAQRRELITPLR